MCGIAMTCAEGIVKFLVAGANLIFALGGLALLIVGILYKINFNHYTDAIPEDYQSIGLAPVLTIVIGAIIFVIAFFGCCGAFRENTCMLSTYAVILLIIFLMQIAIGVFIFLEIKNKDNFETQVNSTLKKVFDSAIQNNNTSERELVDIIQKEFKCCGYNNSSDWGTALPKTCYPDQDSTQTPYESGCVSYFYKFLIYSLQTIGIVVLTLSALEVIGCVFSLCLSSSIKNRERRVRY